MKSSFLRTPLFESDLASLRKRFPGIDDELSALTKQLEDNPRAANSRPIVGTKPTAYKVRLPLSRQNIGKSHGCRAIYEIRGGSVVVFLSIYFKGDRAAMVASEIDQAQKKMRSFVKDALARAGVDPKKFGFS